MPFDDAAQLVFSDQPISQLLVKVAARCNIDCDYCYWFRDAAVYSQPKLMSDKVRQQLVRRIEEHIVKFDFLQFPIILHGGEPMLWGVKNFHRFAEECEAISARTGCDIPLALTTNGILVDDAWLDCFEAHGFGVAISIDGPKHIHDRHRKTFQGTGTHEAVEKAARRLVSRNIGVSALAVCNPAEDPKEYFDFFDSCGIRNFDIMIPDAVVDERPPPIAAFYKKLFDLWFDANRDRETVDIRIVTDMVRALLSNDSPTEGVGYQPIELCTVMTDGSVEAHDVLRIAGNGLTQTTFNIFDNAIDDVRQEARWKAARDASINLAPKCQQCKYMKSCGGGYLPHRFSKNNGYDNPSVYCDDLYATYEHIQSTLQQHVYVSKPNGERVKIGDAMERAGG